MLWNNILLVYEEYLQKQDIIIMLAFMELEMCAQKFVTAD